MNRLSDIAQHYSPSALLEKIDAIFHEQGIDPSRVTPEELAAVDQFHSGGKAATLALASLAGLHQAEAAAETVPSKLVRVLDLGGGIGGPARMLAAGFGCDVTVLDLSEEFCRTGEALTARLGLAERVQFHSGSALEPPFPDASFDLVWTQHASMNIAEKAEVYRQAFRVLRFGGKLAVHDIMAGPESPIHFPVAWASRSEMSFLAAPEQVQQWIAEAGFRLLEWKDMTEVARLSFTSRLAVFAQGGAPALSLKLILGDTFPEVMRNMVRNVEESRVVSAMGVWRKPEFGG